MQIVTEQILAQSLETYASTQKWEDYVLEFGRAGDNNSRAGSRHFFNCSLQGNGNAFSVKEAYERLQIPAVNTTNILGPKIELARFEDFYGPFLSKISETIDPQHPSIEKIEIYANLARLPPGEAQANDGWHLDEKALFDEAGVQSCSKLDLDDALEGPRFVPAMLSNKLMFSSIMVNKRPGQFIVAPSNQEAILQERYGAADFDAAGNHSVNFMAKNALISTEASEKGWLSQFEPKTSVFFSRSHTLHKGSRAPADQSINRFLLLADVITNARYQPPHNPVFRLDMHKRAMAFQRA